MSTRIEIREIFRSSKFGTIYGAYAVTDVRKEDIPNVTRMRRYKDPITEVEAGNEFGFSVEPDPAYQIGDHLELEAEQ